MRDHTPARLEFLSPPLCCLTRYNSPTSVNLREWGHQLGKTFIAGSKSTLSGCAAVTCSSQHVQQQCEPSSARPQPEGRLRGSQPPEGGPSFLCLCLIPSRGGRGKLLLEQRGCSSQPASMSVSNVTATAALQGALSPAAATAPYLQLPQPCSVDGDGERSRAGPSSSSSARLHPDLPAAGADTERHPGLCFSVPRSEALAVQVGCCCLLVGASALPSPALLSHKNLCYRPSTAPGVKNTALFVEVSFFLSFFFLPFSFPFLPFE